jgi:cytochrome c
MVRLTAAAFLLAASLTSAGLAQDFVGHAGPVGALSAAPGILLSGGFDTRAILWNIDDGTARSVTRFHDGTVTAVALLDGDLFVTAGQDGRIVVWDKSQAQPLFATPRGRSAVASLAVSPDRRVVASGYLDGSLQILDLETREHVTERAHSDRVTGLGFLPDGQLISVGADLRFSRWSQTGQLRARAALPALPNGLVMSGTRAAVIFADGALRLFSDDGVQLPERFLTDRPLISVGASDAHIVAGTLDGTVWTLDSHDLAITAMFSAADGPVWAVTALSGHVFTGSADGSVRRWNAVTGQPLGGAQPARMAEYTDDSRGAEIWRACAVCHSLVPEDHSRAGPSLYGIFGRSIASQPGFDYSDALRSLEIVWTPETVAELFEFGPEAYTPGSRMPEQRVADPADRQALVEFLDRATQHMASQ